MRNFILVPSAKMDDPLAICIELQVSVYIEWTPVHSRPLVLNFKMNLLKKEKL